MVVMVVLLGAGFVSCESDTPEPDKNLSLRQLTPDEKVLVESSNHFAFETISQFPQNSNFLFAPVSAGMAVGMLNNALPESADLNSGNSFYTSGFSQMAINKVFSELLLYLNGIDKKNNLAFANSIWLDFQYQQNGLFRDKLMAYYEADVERVEMSRDPVPYINKWTANRTNQLFQELMPSGYLSGSEAVLATGFSFKSGLRDRVKVITAEGNGANWLETHTQILQYQDQDFSLAELKMENEQFHLGFIWSKKEDTGNNKLEYAHLLNFLDQADTLTSSFQFPELKFDHHTDLDKLLPVISQPVYFGLTEKSYPLKFSGFFHKSFIQVRQLHPSTDQNLEIVSKVNNKLAIDRSFTFYVRETHSGLILLIGRYII